MAYVIAVSKSGSNVVTETDPRQFLFHSSYNSFKIITKGTFTKSVIAGVNTETVTHNQGKKVGFYAFMRIGPLDETVGLRVERITFFTNPFNYAFWKLDAYNTNNTLEFTITAPTSGTVFVSWYLFEVATI